MSMTDDTRMILEQLSKLEQAQADSLGQVLARLATVEGVLLGTIGPPRDPGALARIDDVEREVRAMRDEQQWLRRTLVASIVGGAVTIVVALSVAAMSVGA